MNNRGGGVERAELVFGFLWEEWNSPSNTKGQNNSKITPFLKIHNILNQYALIIVIIGGFYWLFFAWSIQFIDIAIASITVELWIVLFVLIRYADKRKPKTNEIGEDDNEIHETSISLSNSIWILFMLSLLGVIYITLSHTTINQSFSYKGLLLLMICVVLSATRVERSIKWAEQMSQRFPKWLEDKQRQMFQIPPHEWSSQRFSKWLEDKQEIDLQQKLPNAGGKKERKKKLERLFMLLCLTIGNIFTIILIILISIFSIFQGNSWNLSFASNSIDLFTNEITINNAVSWMICIGGGFVTAIGTWNLRQGNLETDTLDINGIYYLTPVLSLVWLFPLGLIQLQRWDYFIVGALIIVATSILISIEKDTGRRGFRWLIVSLWSTGLLIYFREIWIQLPWLADDAPWEWSIGSVDYYSLIVLSATIFILILSFRLNRLIERTNNEENQYIRMKSIIKKLSPSFKKSDRKEDILYEDIEWYLYKLDKDDTKNSSENRNNFINAINELRDTIKRSSSDKIKETLERISDLEIEFELLYRSKQRGRYLAENLVLYIFALVTIMVTIGTRPTALSPWNALIIDILAFLFSSAICFMTINLIDLRAYREKSTAELMNTEETGERTKDAINQKAVQVISIILAVVISLSFVVLLYDKWMGIWFL